jgi:hypothetical protein
MEDGPTQDYVAPVVEDIDVTEGPASLAAGTPPTRLTN